MACMNYLLFDPVKYINNIVKHIFVYNIIEQIDIVFDHADMPHIFDHPSRGIKKGKRKSSTVSEPCEPPRGVHLVQFHQEEAETSIKDTYRTTSQKKYYNSLGPETMSKRSASHQHQEQYYTIHLPVCSKRVKV